MAHLHVTRPGIVVPVRVDPTGRTGPTRGQARGTRWRRTGPGFHVPTDVDGSAPAQRIVEAIASLPPGTAATGWAGLSWLGARWFSDVGPDGALLDVPAALGHQRRARPRPGVELSEDWLFDDDVIIVDGLPVTVPERSVSHIARTAHSDLVALRAIDMAAYDDLVDIAGLTRYLARLGPRPGTRRLKRALDRADENVWSPQEVTLRDAWPSHRQDVLLCNAPVFDDAGNHLFTPDLLDVEAGIAGEYDGDAHLERERRGRDLTREGHARRVGIEVVTMLAGPGERRRFHDRLRDAYTRSSRRPAGRSWTIRQPDWWLDTSTVAARRGLSSYEREVWLRHRRT